MHAGHACVAHSPQTKHGQCCVVLQQREQLSAQVTLSPPRLAVNTTGYGGTSAAGLTGTDCTRRFTLPRPAAVAAVHRSYSPTAMRLGTRTPVHKLHTRGWARAASRLGACNNTPQTYCSSSQQLQTYCSNSDKPTAAAGATKPTAAAGVMKQTYCSSPTVLSSCASWLTNASLLARRIRAALTLSRTISGLRAPMGGWGCPPELLAAATGVVLAALQDPRQQQQQQWL